MDNKSMVSRFSNQLKELNTLLGTLKVKVTALNHAESRYRSYSDGGETKGVDADHIKIYELSSVKSFAFAFYYSNTDKPYVMSTTKAGGVMKMAKYHPEAFRVKLNQFVKLLSVLYSADSLSAATAESTFVANFIAGSEYDSTAEVKKVVSTVMERLDALDKENSVKLQQMKSLTESVAKKDAEIKTQVDDEITKSGLRDLRQKLKTAENRVSTFKAKLVDQYGLEAEELKLRYVRRDLHDYDALVDKIITEESAVMPKVARNLAKEKIAVLIERRKKSK